MIQINNEFGGMEIPKQLERLIYLVALIGAPYILGEIHMLILFLVITTISAVVLEQHKVKNSKTKMFIDILKRIIDIIKIKINKTNQQTQ